MASAGITVPRTPCCLFRFHLTGKDRGAPQGAQHSANRGLTQPSAARDIGSLLTMKNNAFRKRFDFSKIPATIQIPNLIEVQKRSYDQIGRAHV